MKKKLVLSVAAAAMVGTLAVGGTLAWFTDTETATNVVTTGKVDIVLNEDGGKDGVVTEEGLSYNDVMPGDTFQKTVTIKNVENDAYVRAKIIVSGTDTVIDTFLNDNEEDDIVFGGLKLGKADWVESGKNELTATVYYDDIMIRESDPWTVFKDITVPGRAWDNAFTNEEFTIKVVAEAIQSSNFESAEDAWGEAGDTAAEIPSGKGDEHGTNDGVKVEEPTVAPQ